MKWLHVIIVLVALTMTYETRADEIDAAKLGVEFLETHCAACHGDDNAFPGLDMRDRTSLITQEDPAAKPFLTPGSPDDSRLWQVIKNHSPVQMPPEDLDQPTAEEIEGFRKWIVAGAEFPQADRPQREFLGEKTISRMILNDVQKADSEQRSFLRYFSLLRMWNDPRVSDEEIRLTRAAVSKLVNSLSSTPLIVAPAEVDPDGVLLRIDMRDYGWTQRSHWTPLLQSYPYALITSESVREQLYTMTLSEMPCIRADWFLFAAPRPELYHRLVTLPGLQGVPKEVRQLEDNLRIDLQSNFESNRLWRAGFGGKKSGVSDNNRIVERHQSPYGYYWPSYDSEGNQQRQDFRRFPLGPRFSESDIAAFDHDGGEFIFSLPNGLQGYMLATADGKRIDIGPDTIVRDPNQFSGSFRIVNGISCMGCHRHGLITFEDSIRELFDGRVDDIAQKVRRLYPDKTTMDRLVARDQAQFLAALDEACGQFLKQGDDAGKDIRDFPEPITTVSRKYDRDLSLADVIRELGLPETKEQADAEGILCTASELQSVLRFNRKLQRAGLLPLATGEAIARKTWEAAYPSAARELRIGQLLIIN